MTPTSNEARLPLTTAVLADDASAGGVLGALVVALAAAEHEWVLAVAAGALQPEPAAVRALWAARDDADAVVFADGRGRRQALPALYRVSACLPAARAVLATGRRRLTALLAAVRVAEVATGMRAGGDAASREAATGNAASGRAGGREAASSAAAAVAVRATRPGATGEPATGGAAASDAARAGAIHPTTPGLRADSGATEAALATPPATPARFHADPVRVELATRGSRPMPSERPMTIYLNDVEIATTQATPRDLEELAVGFLLSEGLLRDRAAYGSADADERRGLVHVTSGESAPAGFASSARYLTSGCGGGVTFSSVGHARGMEPVVSALKVSGDDVHRLMREMASASALYRETGGMHACGLAREGRLLLVREDVGRHNALDKLLGRLWLDGVSTRDSILISTGRISYEMAVKAAKAAIPIVATRSAVTDLAADIGQELGMTLVGYARGGKVVVYTHPERVTSPEGDTE